MIVQIKNKLKNNEELLETILKELNCTKIHKVRDSFRFGRDLDSSGTGNTINIHTLSYCSFSQNINGDIITLVEDIKGISVGESIRWLAQKLNITSYSTTKKDNIILPFNGFFQKYLHNIEEDETPPQTYDETILDEYETCVSLQWIKDGVSAAIQELFGIRYLGDMYGQDRILLPVRNELGQLCGVIGRLNKDNIENWEAKYLSIVPINRSKILFGLYENYKHIMEKQVIYVVEAEKSVMKGVELDMPCVAIGKHSISKRQATLIQSTFCKQVIIAFDEDIPLEECMKEAYKIKVKNPFHTMNIKIVNMDNPYVEKGSKVSLLDLEEEIIEKILAEYLITVD